jgi:DNA-binding XRE family transcriptional regulator
MHYTKHGILPVLPYIDVVTRAERRHPNPREEQRREDNEARPATTTGSPSVDRGQPAGRVARALSAATSPIRRIRGRQSAIHVRGAPATRQRPGAWHQRTSFDAHTPYLLGRHICQCRHRLPHHARRDRSRIVSARTQQSQKTRLGRAVRSLRAEQAMSQERLGICSGLHRNYVGAIERGEINPTFRVLLQLSDGLERPLSDIIVRYEQASPNPRPAPRRRRTWG